jgi:hypothetical protein
MILIVRGRILEATVDFSDGRRASKSLCDEMPARFDIGKYIMLELFMEADSRRFHEGGRRCVGRGGMHDRM